MFKNNVTVIVAGIIALFLMVFCVNKVADDVKSQMIKEETIETEIEDFEVSEVIVLKEHELTDNEKSKVYENGYNLSAVVDLYENDNWIGRVYYDKNDPDTYKVLFNENIIDPYSEEMNKFLYQAIETVNYSAL